MKAHLVRYSERLEVEKADSVALFVVWVCIELKYHLPS